MFFRKLRCPKIMAFNRGIPFKIKTHEKMSLQSMKNMKIKLVFWESYNLLFCGTHLSRFDTKK